MVRKFYTLVSFLLFFSLFAIIPVRAQTQAEEELPREWIDQDTGHRVIRLSDEPGSQSLYFHQNAYTPDGEKLIITTPTGLSTINLKTHAIEKVVEGRVNLLTTGRRTGQAYYVRDRVIYAIDLKTRATKEVAKLPAKGIVANINADETLFVGAITDGEPPTPERPTGPNRDSFPGKGAWMERRLAARVPMQLFTLNIKTGETKTILRSTDWINHIQFSPTDPTLIMFCHEGPWHKVDRTWIIRADGTGLKQIHPRTMNMEIAGHEFFGADGRVIWYDLQTPRSQVFWLAGYNVSTGERVWYHLERSEWSVHYNVSPDGRLFAGDGGGPDSVAAPDNGQWIYLFRPEMVPDRTDGALPNAKELIKPGYFKAEKLVNLAKHNYGLEPNVTFTPDMKWLIFRSNMLGPVHVFAVEIEKTGSTTSQVNH